jgi:hypothetical protein
MSEARTEDRLGRLEEDVHEIKTTLVSLVPMLNRIDERLNTALPHLATKAELAELRTELIDRTGELGRQLTDKPGRGYLWGVMAAMVGAQAVALAAAALMFAIVQVRLQPPASAARMPASPTPAHASIAQPVGERIAGDAQQDAGSPRQLGGLVPGDRDSLAAVPARAAGPAADAVAGVVRHHRRDGGRPVGGLGTRAGDRRAAVGIARMGGDLHPVATRGLPPRTRAIRQAAVVGIRGPDGRILYHYVSCSDIPTAEPPPNAIEPWVRYPLVCPQ